MVMKTQNVNEVLSGINAVQTLFNEKFMIGHLINLKWVEQISSFKFSWKNLLHYILPLLKQGFKEAMGSEVDIELLLILVTGYLLSAKNAIIHNAVIKKIKSPDTTSYQLSNAA
jgi:hypothetical protein